MNKALTKQCWQILKNSDALWVKVLKSRYFPSCSFLDVKKVSRPSWGWNSLMAGRDTIKLNSFWQINNGKLVDVWTDRWVPNSNGGIIKPIDTINRFTSLAVHEVIDLEN